MTTLAYFDGYRAGVKAYKLTGKHEMPSHPHGSTPEGRDWMLGFCEALSDVEKMLNNQEDSDL